MVGTSLHTIDMGLVLKKSDLQIDGWYFLGPSEFFPTPQYIY
jgi:hypothetical protein